jgi:hypothetical protein
MPTWMDEARKLPVTFNKPQMPMHNPVLGAVLHTARAPFIMSWPGAMHGKRSCATMPIDNG